MKNSKIWWFLFRFFGTYFLLFLGYSLFLNVTQKKQPVFTADPITVYVANHTEWLLNLFDKNVYTIQHPEEFSMKVIIDNNFVGRIIEGCNGMSVMILFVAFVIAFKGSFKKTVLFLFIGLFSIYWVNVFRVAFLSYGIQYFKSLKFLLHDLIFPAIIYGYIFVLWIIWVNYFSDLNVKKSE